MRKRKWKHEWPKLTVDMPEAVIPLWLNYTIELLTPRKDVYEHPEDAERNKKRIEACKVLLEYVT